MNFGKFDVMILLTMSLAVISMSFVFPAVGLAGDTQANESDIPEMDISADRFDLAGDFPSAPRTPTEGTLQFDPTESAELSDNRVWLEGDTDNGFEMFLSESGGDGQVTINQWEDGSVVDDVSDTFSSDTDVFGLVIPNEYGVRITAESAEPDDYQVRYEVTQQPEDNEGFIGSLIGTGSDIVSVVGWFVSVFFWFSQWIVSLALNAIGLIFDSLAYLTNLIAWLVTTYTDIIGSANSWAGVFVAIPGILLGAILAKMAFIGVQLLPTT